MNHTPRLKVVEAEDYDGNDWMLYELTDEWLLVSDHLQSSDLGQPEDDAKLFAAAPDLFAALEEVKRDIKRAALNNVVWPSTVKQIDAALRKAQPSE